MRLRIHRGAKEISGTCVEAEAGADHYEVFGVVNAHLPSNVQPVETWSYGPEGPQPLWSCPSTPASPP